MVNEDYRKRALELVKKAKEKGKLKKYNEFCDTKEAKEYALSEEEVIYYTSMVKGEKADEKV